MSPHYSFKVFYPLVSYSENYCPAAAETFKKKNKKKATQLAEKTLAWLKTVSAISELIQGFTKSPGKTLMLTPLYCM